MAFAIRKVGFFLLFLGLFEFTEGYSGVVNNKPAFKKYYGSTAPSFSPLTRLYSTAVEPSEAIKKWYFLNHKKRPDVVMSETTSLTDMMLEIWKAILISIRVLERDENTREYVSVLSFPKLGSSQETTSRVATLIDELSTQLVDASPIFQDNFGRAINYMVGPSDCLLVSIETSRKKPSMVDYEVNCSSSSYCIQ